MIQTSSLQNSLQIDDDGDGGSASVNGKGTPPAKKRFLSGIARKGRGQGGPCPNLLALFNHVTVPYILTSISYFMILFGHF